MYSHKTEQLQMWAWAAGAMTAPLAYYAGRCHWVLVLFTGALCSVICQYVLEAKENAVCRAVWYNGLQFIWLGVALGEMVKWSALCWPSDSGIAAALILLILAAAAAVCGKERIAGVCSVLMWGIAILYIILLAAGISNLHPEWLNVREPLLEDYPVGLIFIFLIPLGKRMLCPSKSKKAWIGMGTMVLFGTLLAIWTIGGLSQSGSRSYAFPFYEFGKSLQLVGSVKRFESLIAVALTAGFFALESMLLTISAELAENVKQGIGQKGIWLGALIAAVTAILGFDSEGIVLGAGSLLFWGLQPFCTIQKEKIKSRKKEKKALDNVENEW